MDKLKATFNNMDLKYEGGESSNEALNRIVSVENNVLASDSENTIIVAHGGVISLLLHYYNRRFGFAQWKTLSNPDVYLLNLTSDGAEYHRLWRED